MDTIAPSGLDEVSLDASRLSRRQMLTAAVGMAAGCLIRAALPAAHAAGESRPEVQPRKAGTMKVGLYSITFLGLWYRGSPLTLEDVVRRAKQYGYDGMEIDGKRPHGNPLDWPTRRCHELRRFADGEGLEIYAVAANNDFSSPIPEHRECQVAYVRELLRMASDLRAKTLRVFLAWAGVTRHPQVGRYDISRPLWETTHRGLSREEIWAWCREGLVETARYAADYGVTLARAEPPAGDCGPSRRIAHGAGGQLALLEDLSGCRHYARPAARSHPPGGYRGGLASGPLALRRRVRPWGGRCAARPRIPAAAGKTPEPDFNHAFVRAMAEIGYQGYVGYELCHPLPVVNGQTVGIEYAEKNARLACEYMRRLIHANER